jgi:hypothetical protein
MSAIDVFFDRKILNGTMPIRDRNGDIVSVDVFKKAFEQYAYIIAFLWDLENKIMTITITEYWQLPSTLIDAMRIYAGVRNEMKAEAMREQ